MTRRNLGPQGIHLIPKVAETMREIHGVAENAPDIVVAPLRYTSQQRQEARRRIENGGTIGLMDVGEIRMDRAPLAYMDLFRALRSKKI